MLLVLAVVQILVAISLIGVILIQRSEGGGLGIGGGGGGGGGMGGFMTARGTSNLLTRTTAVLAGLFLGISLLLAVLGTTTRERRSFIDTMNPGVPAPSSPATPTAPAEPAAPSAPIAR